MSPLVLTLLLAAAPGIEPYPGAQAVSLAPGLEAGDEPFEAAWFVTEDPPERVVDHYAALWEAQGFPVSVEGWAEDRVVSAYLPREALQLAVVATHSGSRTLVFMAVRRLPRDDLPAPVGGPELPAAAMTVRQERARP